MLEICNHTQKVIDTQILFEISQAMSVQDVELLFVDLAQMQQLNYEYRHKNTPTDVLSFPLDSFDQDFMPLGSIVICIPIAEEMATLYHHSLAEEIALLFIHGMLHLLGFDHEKDNGEHRLEEEQWIRRFRLPESLIVRTYKQ